MASFSPSTQYSIPQVKQERLTIKPESSRISGLSGICETIILDDSDDEGITDRIMTLAEVSAIRRVQSRNEKSPSIVIVLDDSDDEVAPRSSFELRQACSDAKTSSTSKTEHTPNSQHQEKVWFSTVSSAKKSSHIVILPDLEDDVLESDEPGDSSSDLFVPDSPTRKTAQLSQGSLEFSDEGLILAEAVEQSIILPRTTDTLGLGTADFMQDEEIPEGTLTAEQILNSEVVQSTSGEKSDPTAIAETRIARMAAIKQGDSGVPDSLRNDYPTRPESSALNIITSALVERELHISCQNQENTPGPRQSLQQPVLSAKHGTNLDAPHMSSSTESSKSTMQKRLTAGSCSNSSFEQQSDVEYLGDIEMDDNISELSDDSLPSVGTLFKNFQKLKSTEQGSQLKQNKLNLTNNLSSPIGSCPLSATRIQPPKPQVTSTILDSDLGSAFLLTPSFILNHPEQLHAFLLWFKDRAKRGETTWRLAGCHNIEGFIQNIAREKHCERESIIWRYGNYAVATECTPGNSGVAEYGEYHSRRKRFFDFLINNVYTEELQNIRYSCYDLLGIICADKSPKSASRSADLGMKMAEMQIVLPELVIHAPQTIDRDDEKGLVEWFADWAKNQDHLLLDTYIVLGTDKAVNFPIRWKIPGLLTIREREESHGPKRSSVHKESATKILYYPTMELFPHKRWPYDHIKLWTHKDLYKDLDLDQRYAYNVNGAKPESANLIANVREELRLKHFTN